MKKIEIIVDTKGNSQSRNQRLCRQRMCRGQSVY